MNNKFSKLIIFSFVLLYLIVSIISTIHAIRFFNITNNSWTMAMFISIAFEIGAASSLAALIIRKYIDIRTVWAVFIVLTVVQILANTFFAYSSINETDFLFLKWHEFVNLFIELTVNEAKLGISITSSAILPLIALAFIKSLTDYLRSFDKLQENTIENVEPITSTNESTESIDINVLPEVEIAKPKRKRGRPVGSKNKTKKTIDQPDAILTENAEDELINVKSETTDNKIDLSPELNKSDIKPDIKKEFEEWYKKF